jgi:antitoxin ParD1/3/4
MNPSGPGAQESSPAPQPAILHVAQSVTGTAVQFIGNAMWVKLASAQVGGAFSLMENAIAPRAPQRCPASRPRVRRILLHSSGRISRVERSTAECGARRLCAYSRHCSPCLSLPDSLKDFIEQQVQTKGYGNVSEYVRGLQTKEADARLEALLIDGLANGKETAVSPEFWSELKQDATKILAKHKQSGKARAKRGARLSADSHLSQRNAAELRLAPLQVARR